jgi:hypothetical protein
VCTNAAWDLSGYLRRRHTTTAAGINSHNSEAPEPDREMLHPSLSAAPPGAALVLVAVSVGGTVFVRVGVAVGCAVGVRVLVGVVVFGGGVFVGVTVFVGVAVFGSGVIVGVELGSGVLVGVGVASAHVLVFRSQTYPDGQMSHGTF